MGVLWGGGRPVSAGRQKLCAAIGSVLGFALLLSVASGKDAGADGNAFALRYHATITNRELVGSAFAVSRGVVVTNAHVVEGRAPGEKVRIVASHRGGGRTSARVVAISDRMDMAILSVPDSFLPPVSASRAHTRKGLRVIAAGVDAGGGPDSGARLELSGRILDPVANISAFGPGLIASIPGVRPGFSGGPLLSPNGGLVGMVTAIRPGPASTVRIRSSGFAPIRKGQNTTTEAYVLRAPEIRKEIRRLLNRTRKKPGA